MSIKGCRLTARERQVMMRMFDTPHGSLEVWTKLFDACIREGLTFKEAAVLGSKFEYPPKKETPA